MYNTWVYLLPSIFMTDVLKFREFFLLAVVCNRHRQNKLCYASIDKVYQSVWSRSTNQGFHLCTQISALEKHKSDVLTTHLY